MNDFQFGIIIGVLSCIVYFNADRIAAAVIWLSVKRLAVSGVECDRRFRWQKMPDGWKWYEPVPDPAMVAASRQAFLDGDSLASSEYLNELRAKK